MKKALVLLLCISLCFSFTHAQKSETFSKEAVLSSLFETDILSLRHALDCGLITSVELTEYYLERIDAYNEEFNCFITLCDNALEVAAQRDKALAKGSADGLLWGIPVVVKDNIAYEGYPTTDGLWGFFPKETESAAVVQALLNEGAVILGKTNMATEAQEARFSASDAVGETKNAYSSGMSSGGSSGGSAVAVSLNFCAAGLGTDTNASLRYPAVLNGCVSLRPTVGLIDRSGCTVLNYSRDTPGAITRSVVDQAIMLDVLTGGSYYESLNVHALEGARIGILRELSYAAELSYGRSRSNLDDEILAAFSQAVRELRACGATVFEVSIPNLFSLSESCEYGSSYSKQRYLEIYEALFEDRDLDAVIFPTYLHTPQGSLDQIGWKEYYDTPFLSNCNDLSSPLGVPEIALPIGLHSKNAGIGLEIAALNGEEQKLLDLAYSYTSVYDHRVTPNPAADLYADHYEAPLAELLQQQEKLLTESSPTAATETAEETEVTYSTQASTTQEPTTDATTVPAFTPNPSEHSQGYAPSPASFLMLLPLFIVLIICACYFFHKQKRRRKSKHRQAKTPL